MHGRKDRKFFEENILVHYDAIFKFALSLTKKKEAAEDITQLTTEKAWAKLSQLKQKEKAKSWVFQIARNEIRLHFRREKRDGMDAVLLSEAEAEISVHGLNTEDIYFNELESKEDLLCVARATERLPEKYREVLVLWSQGDMTEKEIGEVLGLNYNTIRVLFYRGIKKLRQIYLLERGAQDEE